MAGVRNAPPVDSWRALYDEHWRWVHATVRRMGGTGIDVEDAVQDVFVVLVTRLASFEGRASLRTWLYRICFNVVSEHRRKVQRRRRIAQALEWVTVWQRTPSAEEQAETRRDLARVHTLLDRMAPQKRAVFVLREIEGKSYEEIAEITGCNLGTVKSRLNRARNSFAAIISPSLD